MGVGYGKVFSSTNAALTSCKKQDVKQVILTLRADDAAENNIFSGLLALQLYAEHAYADELEMDKLKRRVQFCTGVAFEAGRGLQMAANYTFQSGPWSGPIQTRVAAPE